MRREQFDVGRYYRLSPQERINSIIRNYGCYQGIIDDYRRELYDWIDGNREKARRDAIGDLGVRICSGAAFVSSTENAVNANNNDDENENDNYNENNGRSCVAFLVFVEISLRTGHIVKLLLLLDLAYPLFLSHIADDTLHKSLICILCLFLTLGGIPFRLGFNMLYTFLINIVYRIFDFSSHLSLSKGFGFVTNCSKEVSEKL